MLVGGELGTRATLAVALEQAFVVDVASTGTKGLHRLHSAVPDLVICDVSPPVGESVGFLRTLLARHPSRPVIIASTGDEDHVLQLLAPDKVHGFLKHPVHLGDLLDRIAAFLELGEVPLLSTRRVSRRLSQALVYLSAHYGRGATVQTVASATNLSTSCLRELCRAEIGLSPGELLRRVRVKAAIESFVTGEEKFSSIALLCGFYDASHMSTVIRVYTGLRPSEHRKRYLQELLSFSTMS